MVQLQWGGWLVFVLSERRRHRDCDYTDRHVIYRELEMMSMEAQRQLHKTKHINRGERDSSPWHDHKKFFVMSRTRFFTLNVIK